MNITIPHARDVFAARKKIPKDLLAFTLEQINAADNEFGYFEIFIDYNKYNQEDYFNLVKYLLSLGYNVRKTISGIYYFCDTELNQFNQ